MSVLVDWPLLLGPVIIAVVPIIVAILKRVLPTITFGWTYPILSMLLAVGLDYLSRFATSTSVGPDVAAALGLAAIGLRELIDQLKKVLLGRDPGDVAG